MTLTFVVLRYREDVMLPDGQIARVNRSLILGSLAEIPTRRIAPATAQSFYGYIMDNSPQSR